MHKELVRANLWGTEPESPAGTLAQSPRHGVLLSREPREASRCSREREAGPASPQLSSVSSSL